jgi:hypothetical protein
MIDKEVILQPKKRYALNQSPLYKLQSKKRLAELLGLPVSELLELAPRSDNYQLFTIHKNNKPREVQVPRPALKAIHKQLFRLLQRVEPPEYLQSGCKGRSHVTNARVHDQARLLVKLDIKAYYQSTKRDAVYQFFRKTMSCSPDVAGLLSDLSCVSGHIPTGSPLSQILAFYASLPLFQEIARASESEGITFTVYVDDLTFSGEKITGQFIWTVKQLISGRGYTYHKEASSAPFKPRIVTGVVLTKDGLRVRNKHHKAIYGLYRQHLEGQLHEADKPQLFGMLSSASQVSAKYRRVFKHVIAEA